MNTTASASAGDLMMLIFVSDEPSTITDPGGWTICRQHENTDTFARIYYKVAAGGEGSTETITTSGTQQTASVAYRITSGTYSGVPECSTANQGAANADVTFGVHDPTGGAGDILWVAVGWWGEGTNSTIVSCSTNYGTTVSIQSGTGIGGESILTCRRELNAATEQPGTMVWTQSGGGTPVGVTIAIQPVAGPAARAGIGLHLLKR